MDGDTPALSDAVDGSSKDGCFQDFRIGTFAYGFLGLKMEEIHVESSQYAKIVSSVLSKFMI